MDCDGERSVRQRAGSATEGAKGATVGGGRSATGGCVRGMRQQGLADLMSARGRGEAAREAASACDRRPSSATGGQGRARQGGAGSSWRRHRGAGPGIRGSWCMKCCKREAGPHRLVKDPLGFRTLICLDLFLGRLFLFSSLQRSHEQLFIFVCIPCSGVLSRKNCDRTKTDSSCRGSCDAQDSS